MSDDRGNGAGDLPPETGSEAQTPVPLDEQIKQAQAEAAEYKDRLLRALAETENVRRRAERDRSDATKYGVTQFARDLLDVADNLRRALESVPESQVRDDVTRNLLAGVAATERALLSALERHGIRRLVYTSSPSVVFDGRDMENADETAPYPAHYETAYPETKALAERAVLAANAPDLATVALRPHASSSNHANPRAMLFTKLASGSTVLLDATMVARPADSLDSIGTLRACSASGPADGTRAASLMLTTSSHADT